jgi:hypothetical protein
MKKNIKHSFLVLAIAVMATSCTKYSNDIDAASNTNATTLASAALNNRVVAGFILDANTLPNVAASVLPVGYNPFRKILTYDTIATVNKAPAYKAGDVINIVGYLKGDDFAISKRRINVSLYKAPTAFITPANPPSVINVMQNAEDRYRSYQPGAAGSATAADSAFTLTTITPTNVSPFNVLQVMNETVNGVNINTYMVHFTFTVPAPTATKWISGQVFSINLNAGVAANDLGNINWIYAFRVR